MKIPYSARQGITILPRQTAMLSTTDILSIAEILLLPWSFMTNLLSVNVFNSIHMDYMSLKVAWRTFRLDLNCKQRGSLSSGQFVYTLSKTTIDSTHHLILVI